MVTPTLGLNEAMRIWRGLDSITEPLESCTLAIGVFDGIHLGHRKLIQQGVLDARRNDRPFALMTFDRHPSELIAPGRAPAHLMTPDQRIRLLEPLGVDDLVIARFDERFRSLSPESFLRFVVCGVLGARAVFVGSDFRFGMDQAGDTRYLTSAGERFGFSVNIVQPVLVDGKKAGSSRVRELIHAGAVTEASEILERPYALVGRVVAGKQLGRKLGFPTANVETEFAMAVPADGVYAVWVSHGGQRHMGACSIGFRPTVKGTERTVEVYLLDFDGDLYGEELEVEFIARLREELEFHSLDDLVKQMHDDVSETRRILQELA